MPSDRLWRLGKIERKVSELREQYERGEFLNQDYLDDLKWVKNEVDRIWYELEPTVRRGE